MWGTVRGETERKRGRERESGREGGRDSGLIWMGGLRYLGLPVSAP